MSIYPLYKTLFFRFQFELSPFTYNTCNVQVGQLQTVYNSFVHQVLLLTVYMTLCIAVRKAIISEKAAF